MSPDPDKGLHANRPYSVPWKTHRPKNCMSRGDILSGSTPTAFGSEQPLQVAVDQNEATERPEDWYNRIQLVRVNRLPGRLGPDPIRPTSDLKSA
jgi:hypothetical protein